MSKDFFAERNLNCANRIENVLKDLPPYVGDYLIGIESRTSALTRLNYVYDLRIFFGFLATKVFTNVESAKQITLEKLDSLDSFVFEKFISYLGNYELNGKFYSCNEQAKKRKLASVRAFFKYFYNKGLLDSNPASKVSLPKIHEKEIVRLEVDEVVKFLNEAEFGEGLSPHMKTYHENTKLRDLAILSLFLGTGIRISELVGLNVDDIDFMTNAFIVTRKGGNRTILYFPDEVGETLYNYYVERNEKMKNKPEERALFLSLQNKRISARAVENLVKKYAGLATPLKHITPHKLRSTYGTNLYRETGDIYQVADCLGHKDVNTTRRHYAAVAEDSRKNSAKVIKLRNKD